MSFRDRSEYRWGVFDLGSLTKGLFTLSQVPNLQEGRLIGHNQGYSMINERNEMQPIIRTLQVTRVYHVDSREIPALRGVDLSIGPGQVVALRGRSGSG